MQLACSTASFPQDRLQIAIAKVGWAEYPGIEIVVPGDGLPDEEELRERLRANDLVLAAIHAGTLPAAVGPAAVEELGRIGRAAAFAQALDGSRVVLQAPEAGSLPELAGAARLLDAALGRLGVELCLANRSGTLLAEREALTELWGYRLPARVGLALDPGEAAAAGWDPLDLDALPALPRHVYLTDASRGRVVPVGEGGLNLEGLVRALGAAGYAESLVVRLENADAWAVEPIAKEIREGVAAWLEGAG
jgi:sugar phosphate isomerase/epimerase